MTPEDEVAQALTKAAQETLGRLATAHPWLAGLALVAACGGFLLGLVSGRIKPESLSTPRRRAGARLALRYGVAFRGSWPDVSTLITGIEVTPPPTRSRSLQARSPRPPHRPTRRPPCPRLRGRLCRLPGPSRGPSRARSR